jgi:SAM-dependent methyltransferase
MSPNDWNREYSEGIWDFLNDPKEVAHYAVTAAMVRHFSDSDLILDVACGEGVLQQYLRPLGYGSYLGIDKSPAAIDKALARKDDRTSFMVADVEHFTPSHRFSCIIFSECLYYFSEPNVVIQHYANWLVKAGVMVTSIYASHESENTCIKTDSLTLLEETTVINTRGAWKCAVFSRKA